MGVATSALNNKWERIHGCDPVVPEVSGTVDDVQLGLAAVSRRSVRQGQRPLQWSRDQGSQISEGEIESSSIAGSAQALSANSFCASSYVRFRSSPTTLPSSIRMMRSQWCVYSCSCVTITMV